MNISILFLFPGVLISVWNFIKFFKFMLSFDDFLRFWKYWVFIKKITLTHVTSKIFFPMVINFHQDIFILLPWKLIRVLGESIENWRGDPYKSFFIFIDNHWILHCTIHTCLQRGFVYFSSFYIIIALGPLVVYIGITMRRILFFNLFLVAYDLIWSKRVCLFLQLFHRYWFHMFYILLV